MNFGIAMIIRWAETVGLMIEWFAESTDTTSALHEAWVDALSVKTRLVEGTVCVRSTANEAAM